MDNVADRLQPPTTRPGDDKPEIEDRPDEERPESDFKSPYPDAVAAFDTLQELRRLFFSIVEHLQETAQRQVQLNDETEQLAGTPSESEPDAETKSGRRSQLSARQSEVAQIADQIAETLEQQANQQPDSSGNADVDPQQQELMEQNAE